mmetsp:Transcript_15300/g.33779  ORF Transcript_15300/g.33779 Transcript_15300/m.33779 type:complete len:322 (+) Transcript_15300:469-1434(+)
MPRTDTLCHLKERISLPVARFHSLTVASSLQERITGDPGTIELYLLSMGGGGARNRATPYTTEVCPSSSKSRCPDKKSHTRTVWSLLPDTITVATSDAALKASLASRMGMRDDIPLNEPATTALISSSCPSSIRRWSPVSRSHTRIFLSAPPESTTGLAASGSRINTVMILLVWPRKLHSFFPVFPLHARIDPSPAVVTTITSPSGRTAMPTAQMGDLCAWMECKHLPESRSQIFSNSSRAPEAMSVFMMGLASLSAYRKGLDAASEMTLSVCPSREANCCPSDTLYTWMVLSADAQRDLGTAPRTRRTALRYDEACTLAQ